MSSARPSLARQSEISAPEKILQGFLEQWEQEHFFTSAHQAFAERNTEETAAEASNPTRDANEELLIRDSRRNPKVLEYRRDLALDKMRRHKLRYRETHAKKLFLEMLRNGVSVTHEDNAKLRDENMKHKAELKAVKSELRGEYDKISASSAEVGKKAKIIQAQLDQGTELVKKIQEMRWELNVIRSSTTADKRLTPEQISDRLADNDDRLLELDDQEKQLTDQLESMRAEIARIKARMEKLAVDRPRAAAQALKLHQMDLNERAEIAQLVNTRRQLIEFNKRLMAVQSVTAPSENELRIAFEAERPPSAVAHSPAEVITLSLVFNPANRRLAAAQLIGSDVNIDELRLVAIETNDIPAFVRDVRRRLTGMMNLEHEGLA